MNCWKPKKTVAIESPADLDRTTTQSLGKANPMVEVIIRPRDKIFLIQALLSIKAPGLRYKL